MMRLAFAAALPVLLWNQPPDTASAVRDAGITTIQVPADRYGPWKTVTDPAATPADLRNATKLIAPHVDYRANEATPSRQPWIMSNGWRFLRNPQSRYYYDVQGEQAALAAAEAFCFGGTALVGVDAAGVKPFADMLAFLRGLGGSDGAAIADIGFLDDRSATAGEVMNLMVRNNLMFIVVPRPDPRLKLNVQLGSKEFPREDARNPGTTAHQVRARLTDDRRSLRVYGSAVVVARLTALPAGVRVHLLNYDAASRKVDGLHVRVLGSYPKSRVAAAGDPEAKLLDYTTDNGVTEFTLPELKTYAVIDLSR